MARAETKATRAEADLRKFALGYPEAYEDFPWGERAIKVKGKVFVFLNIGEEGLSMATKLPGSGAAALLLPFAEPTQYGLGKSGWVTARFKLDQEPPLDLLYRWIEESYRAIAPKKLVALLPAGGSGELARAKSKRP